MAGLSICLSVFKRELKVFMVSVTYFGWSVVGTPECDILEKIGDGNKALVSLKVAESCDWAV